MDAWMTSWRLDPPVVVGLFGIGLVYMAVAVAVLLYLHRYCLSTADRAIKDTLGLNEEETAFVLSAFFLP